MSPAHRPASSSAATSMSHPRPASIFVEPAGQAIEARPGESILHAAQRHGVHIDSSCGGSGSCLQCRISVVSGSARVPGSGEARLASVSGGAPVPLDERRTPSGEEQGRHRAFLSCSVTALGDLHIRVEPRGGIGARILRPTLVGQCAACGSLALPANLPDELRVTIHAAATSGLTPWLSIRTADLTIAGAGLAPAATGGATGPLTVSGDGLPMRMIPLGPDPLRRLFLAGCFAHRRKPGCVFVALGQSTRVTVKHGASGDPSDSGSWRHLTIGTPVFGDADSINGLQLMPAIAGAVHSVEFSPMTPRAILSTVGDAMPTGISLSGAIEFMGSAIRAGILNPDGTFNPCRNLQTGPHGPEFVLTSPGVAAMSATGKVWNAPSPVAIPQSAIIGMLSAFRRITEAIATTLNLPATPAPNSPNAAVSETVLVIGGGHGFHPSRQALDALPLLHWLAPGSNPATPTTNTIRIESVGDAISLGAAILAAESLHM